MTTGGHKIGEFISTSQSTLLLLRSLFLDNPPSSLVLAHDFSPKPNTSSSPKKNPRLRKPQSSWKQFKSLIPLSSWNQIRKSVTCGAYSKLNSSPASIRNLNRDVGHENNRVDDHSSTRSSVLNVGLHGNGSYPNSKTTSISVSELGPEDLGRDTIEMIFKSSLGKDDPICKIERVLKVHNTQTRIQRFEECRESAQKLSRCNANRNPRCAADGNEQLRFQCTSLACSLGHSTTNLCDFVDCGVCSVLRHGFPGCNVKGLEGVHTTATCGKAHSSFGGVDWNDSRAMLVCRVIAGRVKHVAEEDENINVAVAESYDAVGAGCYERGFGKFDELFVFSPEAVLPCFVVIYASHQ
ncbi:uncharacterized protein LOC113351194 [Papaver somniferum]|uniref:uncharacterized protein LOC113351194 n=1 Tax=Papaver somniferum TaxID=3469 RepID=UPI000E6FC2E1|nr:uncharacterized protein LOC113351194 [Papaver somniferum]